MKDRSIPQKSAKDKSSQYDTNFMIGPELQELYVWLYGEYAKNNPNISDEQAHRLFDALVYTITLGADKCPDAGCESCYHAGQTILRGKLSKMKEEYQVLLEGLKPPVNERYYKGILELSDFFLHYDPKFAPQDSVIPCSYPVIVPISGADGIEKAEAYLNALFYESQIIRCLDHDQVTQILEKWPENPDSSPLKPILMELFACALLRRERLLAENDLPELSQVLSETDRAAMIMQRAAERLSVGAGLSLPCRHYLKDCLPVIQKDLETLRKSGNLSKLAVFDQLDEPEDKNRKRTLSHPALRKLALRVKQSDNSQDRIKIIFSYHPTMMDLLDLMDLYPLSSEDFQALCEYLGPEKQMELIEKLNQGSAVAVRNW